MIIKQYNIHELLTLKLICNKYRGFMAGVNSPFSYFEVDYCCENPDITIALGPFNPSNENCFFVDHKYLIKPNYFYCRDYERRTSWELEIKGFENGITEIFFDYKSIGLETYLAKDLIPQEQIVKFLVGYKLSLCGYYLLHSAAVACGNNGFLLMGRGGSNKTKLTIDLVNDKSFKCLGDDWVILDINNTKIFSYPVPIQPLGFAYNTTRIATEKSRSIWDMLSYSVFSSINKNLNNVPIQDQANLRAILVITKSTSSKLKISKIVDEKLSTRMVVNNQLEAMMSPRIFGNNYGRYYLYLLAYAFVFPNSKLATYWQSMEQNLSPLSIKLPIFNISIPTNYDKSQFIKAFEQIENEVCL